MIVNFYKLSMETPYREVEKLLVDDPALHFAIEKYAEDEKLKIYKLWKNMIMTKDNYILAMEEN